MSNSNKCYPVMIELDWQLLMYRTFTYTPHPSMSFVHVCQILASSLSALCSLHHATSLDPPLFRQNASPQIPAAISFLWRPLGQVRISVFSRQYDRPPPCPRKSLHCFLL